MIKTNNGKQNETTILNYINTKRKISEMNDNIKNFIKFLFPTITEKDSVFAKKYGENYKPDITIEFNGTKKYISIKKGESNSVHQEHIYSFINYIEDLGAEKQITNIIRKFHFNDGSIDGSGKVRKAANDFQDTHKKEIQIINNYFNSNNNKRKIIERLLIKGEYPSVSQVDALYHGTIEKGVWANSDEIIKYLNEVNLYSSSPHVSKLYYQSLHRNLKQDIYFEFRRYYVQFKWYSIKDDLTSISIKRK